MTRRLLLAILVCSAMLVSTSSVEAAFTFDDVENWTGSGSNQAVMIIDWNDGIDSESLAWGFRWDDTATGADMFTAIVGADDRLYAKLAPGSVYGMGYDLDDDGFAVSDGTVFDQGNANLPGPGDDSTASLDLDDHYLEGWMSAGYWSYWLYESSPFNGGWEGSLTGMGGRALTNGAWDGWSFAPASSNWYSGPPDAPVAAASSVPEPGSLLTMLGLGSVFGAGRWLRRRKAGFSL